MNKFKLNIWGRDFNLAVYFDDKGDSNLAKEQSDVLNKFIEMNNKDVQTIFSYVKNDSNADIDTTNIFKYVVPHYVIVNESNNEIILLCHYKFEIEHGLAIVYKGNKIVKIAIQDEVL